MDPIASDWPLLDRYLETGDQAAFRALVDAHVALVFNLARREFRGNPGHAQDVAQTVFLILARKGRSIPRHKTLVAWLYQTTRYCCANLARMESRRVRHERKAAMYVQIPSPPAEPHLDMVDLLNSGLASLGEKERSAVLLRYLEEKTTAQAAATLGISADALQKRCDRALDRLRLFFQQRGLLTTAADVSSLLAAETAAGLPTTLFDQVLDAALRGKIKPSIASLMDGYRRTGLKPRAAAAIVLLTLGLGLAVLFLILNSVPAPPKAFNQAAIASTHPAMPATTGPAAPVIATTLQRATYCAYVARNVFAGGDFRQVAAGGRPANWRNLTAFDEGLASMTAQHRLQLTSRDPTRQVEVSAALDLNPAWKKLAVRSLLRVVGVRRSAGSSAAGVAFYFLDANQKPVGTGLLLPPWATAPTYFKMRLGTLVVPENAASLVVSVRLVNCAGKIEVSDIVVMPVDEKIDPDPQAVVELHEAISTGNVDQAIKMIVADKRLLESRNMDWNCGTPLLGAVETNHPQLIPPLLKLGADCTAETLPFGPRAVDLAVWYGRPSCLEMLWPHDHADPQLEVGLINAALAHNHNGGSRSEYELCRQFLDRQIAVTQPSK
jgi:RNA polymerase sigma factor (sigma-70 family)